MLRSCLGRGIDTLENLQRFLRQNSYGFYLGQVYFFIINNNVHMWYHAFVKYIFSAVFTREEGGYSVLCPELGVASQGRDLKEAETNIREAVGLYIEDMSKEELAPYSQARTEDPILKTFEVSHV
jgi:predicted RNase H-like HicB family nuclease